jgi:hypothetical protein
MNYKDLEIDDKIKFFELAIKLNATRPDILGGVQPSMMVEYTVTTAEFIVERLYDKTP